MSFANEIRDFVNVALAVRKSMGDSASQEAKARYYQDIVGIRRRDSAVKAAQGAARLNQKAFNDAENRKLRVRRLGQIDDDQKRKKDEAAGRAEERTSRAAERQSRMDHRTWLQNKPPKAAKPDARAIDLVEDTEAEDAAAARFDSPDGASPMGAAPVAPARPRAPAPAQALPIGPGAGADPDDEEDPDDGDDGAEEEEEVGEYAEGGLVQPNQSTLVARARQSAAAPGANLGAPVPPRRAPTQMSTTPTMATMGGMAPSTASPAAMAGQVSAMRAAMPAPAATPAATPAQPNYQPATMAGAPVPAQYQGMSFEQRRQTQMREQEANRAAGRTIGSVRTPGTAAPGVSIGRNGQPEMTSAQRDARMRSGMTPEQVTRWDAVNQSRAGLNSAAPNPPAPGMAASNATPQQLAGQRSAMMSAMPTPRAATPTPAPAALGDGTYTGGRGDGTYTGGRGGDGVYTGGRSRAALPVAGFNEGGLVRRYDAGGAVEDDSFPPMQDMGNDAPVVPDRRPSTVTGGPQDAGRDEFDAGEDGPPPGRQAIPQDMMASQEDRTPPMQDMGNERERRPAKHEPGAPKGDRLPTATKNSFGFDAAAAINSWSPDANPITLGLNFMMKPAAAPAPSGALPVSDPSAAPAAPAPSLADRVARNEGAAGDADVKALNQIVDPRAELKESARTIARLDATVKHYLAKGDSEKAAKVASSLIMYGKLQSQKFGSLAMTAMKQGDTKRAVQYLERAYDFIPDGRELKAEIGKDGLVRAQVVDWSKGMGESPEAGEVEDLGTFGPQQVLKFSLGVANGSEYMKNLMSVASKGKTDEAEAKHTAKMAQEGVRGAAKVEAARVTQEGISQRQQAQAAERANRPMKMSDRTRVEEAMEAVDAQIKLAPGMDEAHRGTIKNTAGQIYGANEGMSPEGALKLISELTDVNAPPPYKIEQGQNGMFVATSAAGHQFRLPRNVVASIAQLRAMQKQAAGAQSAAAAERKALEEKRDAAARRRQQSMGNDPSLGLVMP